MYFFYARYAIIDLKVKLQLITIETELENERKQRNKLQIERDKLHQFWDISRDQTKEIKKALFDESQRYNETNGKLQNDIGVEIAHLMVEFNQILFLSSFAFVVSQ